MGNFQIDITANMPRPQEKSYSSTSDRTVTDITEPLKPWLVAMSIIAIVGMISIGVIFGMRERIAIPSSDSSKAITLLDSAQNSLNNLQQKVDSSAKEKLQSAVHTTQQARESIQRVQDKSISDFTFYMLCLIAIIAIVIVALLALTASRKHSLQARVAELEILSKSVTQEIIAENNRELKGVIELCKQIKQIDKL